MYNRPIKDKTERLPDSFQVGICCYHLGTLPEIREPGLEASDILASVVERGVDEKTVILTVGILPQQSYGSEN